jgi:hypothetical protein
VRNKQGKQIFYESEKVAENAAHDLPNENPTEFIRALRVFLIEAANTD